LRDSALYGSAGCGEGIIRRSADGTGGKSLESIRCLAAQAAMGGGSHALDQEFRPGAPQESRGSATFGPFLHTVLRLLQRAARQIKNRTAIRASKPGSSWCSAAPAAPPASSSVSSHHPAQCLEMPWHRCLGVLCCLVFEGHIAAIVGVAQDGQKPFEVSLFVAGAFALDLGL
jgi:hypothetical protein